MRALWLVGMMGSGKTTVGELIAQRSGLVFVDTDSLIEDETERSISSIWEAAGEEAFRDLETKQIERLLTTPGDCVVATGGGAVLRRENVAAMRNNGTVVWLTAGRHELAARLRKAKARPLLVDQRIVTRLADLMAERGAAYAEAAHYSVDTAAKSPDEVAREVMLLWNG